MEPAITAYPNGHDSTGMPEEVGRRPVPKIEITRAGGVFDSRELEARESPRGTDQVPARRISTEELYEKFENVSPELNSAVRLLSLCLEHIGQALEADRRNDPIEADDATQRLQGLLPELFCCRSLGDGFGIIVNGLMCGFQNLGGIPLRREQMEKVRQVLIKLHSEPFLRAEDAVKTITALDESGLVLEPAEFDYLADMLDE